MDLDNQQLSRYERNISLETLGLSGQKRLLESSVLVIGAGGLGSPVLMYLAGAGVGRIGVADCDSIDLSNLNRQILYTHSDIGKNKAVTTCEKISEFNPDISTESFTDPVRSDNISVITQGFDFIVECSDNFSTKYLVNDFCVASGLAFSHAGVSEMNGQVMTYVPGKACLRCLFNDPFIDKERGRPAGILGAAAGIAGSVQASETVKFLCGSRDLIVNSVYFFNLATGYFRRLSLIKREGCICS